jgi:regulator of sigma E protease
MLGTLVALGVVGLLILLHELGHFFVARWVGVRVLRFSIGFGARIAGWRRRDTEYQLSWIPLGGYVKMAGEQRSDEPPKAGDYTAQPVGTRALIVAAGPVMNYLVALLLVWLMLILGSPGLLPVVGKTVDGMPAAAAGFAPGDRIVRINGQPVRTWPQMSAMIQASPEQPLQIEVRRGERLLSLAVTPAAESLADAADDADGDHADDEVTPPDGGGDGERERARGGPPPARGGSARRIGLIGITPGELRLGPLAALGESVAWLTHLTWLTLRGLWAMVTGQVPWQESVAGPIRIVSWTSQAWQAGLVQLAHLVSLISLSLAILNFLPIPILDGGHLFFLAIERLRGRPLSLMVQERSAQISFAVLMALILVVCFNDISRLGWLERLGELLRR